jgi:hypothetical protein
MLKVTLDRKHGLNGEELVSLLSCSAGANGNRIPRREAYPTIERS